MNENRLVTDRQIEIVKCIEQYIDRHKMAPGQSDIARKLKVKAPTIHKAIHRLLELKVLGYKPGAMRSLRVLIPSDGLKDIKRPERIVGPDDIV